MEYPITFNEQSIRAILAGKKTQTRKVIHWHSKNPTKTHIPPHAFYEGFINERFQWYESRDGIEIQALCPYGKIGDTLWVKESLRRYTRLDFLESKPVITNQWLETTFPDCSEAIKAEGKWTTQYAATNTAVPYMPGAKEGWCGTALWQWKNKSISPILMPKWASRITLKITDIRAEHLQDISDEDAMKEGVLHWYYEVQYDENSFSYWSPIHGSGAASKFFEMWNSINGKTKYSWDNNPWVWVVEFRIL